MTTIDVTLDGEGTFHAEPGRNLLEGRTCLDACLRDPFDAGLEIGIGIHVGDATRPGRRLEARLKGKTHPMTIHEILGLAGSAGAPPIPRTEG